jgi:putative DNA primase/helicase
VLKLRRRNISAMIIHHANKSGDQRGTSRREDVLDTVICLRRPSDYEPTEGARFEVHIEKSRGVAGDALKPFEAKFEVRENAAVWTTRELEDVRLAQVKLLTEDGLSLREIADATGIPKTTVARLQSKIKAENSAGNHDDK